MEEEPELVDQITEGGRADSSWVLRPELPSGTSIELAILTNANHPSPEMLDLLQRLMVRVQESETNEGPVERDCQALQDCHNYRADTCGQLTSCVLFQRPQ